MKKQIFFATLLLAAVLFGTSCKKSSPEAPAPTYALEGSWVGGYGLGTSAPTVFYIVHFRSDGTVIVESDDATNTRFGRGTWTLTGNDIRFRYTIFSPVPPADMFSVAGKYNSTSNIITGTFGFGTSTTNRGTIRIVKK